MRLLLVDSDRDMVEMLAGWLKSHGYELHFAFDAERARAEWVQYQPDLVILDAALRGIDVLDLCRELRIKHDPLLLITARPGNPDLEVRSLESGADDYLEKPFYPRQLLAHIKAVSRRARSSLHQRPSSVLTVGPLRVDSLRSVVYIRGKTVRLTPTESKLLHLLAINANEVCTADQIVMHVWGYSDTGDVGLIKAHIRHLREKLEVDPSRPQLIITIPGMGYSLHRLVQKSDEVVPSHHQALVHTDDYYRVVAPRDASDGHRAAEALR